LKGQGQEFYEASDLRQEKAEPRRPWVLSNACDLELAGHYAPNHPQTVKLKAWIQAAQGEHGRRWRQRRPAGLHASKTDTGIQGRGGFRRLKTYAHGWL